MSALDYSKWAHIEVSDDEDDTHPNIDTPSLFRWRHQARLERDAAWNKEKFEFEANYKTFLEKLQSCRQKLDDAKRTGASDVAELNKQFQKLLEEENVWKTKESEMKKKEKLRPWNIDTICREGKSKTVINSAALKHPEHVESPEDAEEAAINRLKDFVDKHGKTIRQFGMFRKPTDSQNFLLEHTYLVCEETANQLVLWCIDLAVEEKFDLMAHVSHQCIVMQFILELAKSLKCDPRACIRPFFSKFIDPEPDYHKAFDDELTAFRSRIRDRAKVRIEEAMQKLEEEEREKRLGPGGLDPLEVFDTLPKELQNCFEKKDVELLKTVLIAMDPKDAEYHMQRCVASGLWVDNVNKEQSENVPEGGDETEPQPTAEGETVHQPPDPNMSEPCP